MKSEPTVQLIIHYQAKDAAELEDLSRKYGILPQLATPEDQTITIKPESNDEELRFKQFMDYRGRGGKLFRDGWNDYRLALADAVERQDISAIDELRNILKLQPDEWL